METIDLEIQVPDKINLERAHNFFKYYFLEKSINSNNKVFLGDKKSRKCRFCRRKSPEVTFKKVAHVIPELLTRNKCLSYFECDDCNLKFSKYETDLASYLHLFRIFSTYRNKNKRLKHKEFDESGSEKGFIEKISKSKILVESKKPNTITKHYPEENKIVIETVVPSYVPLNVYKVFLKIAISLVDEDDLDSFTDTADFLLNKNQKNLKVYKEFFNLIYYFIPGMYMPEEVKIALARKKPEYTNERIPDRVFLMKYHKLNYQLFIPFNKNDDFFFEKDGEINLHLYPLIIDFDYFSNSDNAKYTLEVDNLFSSNKVRKKKASLELRYSKKEQYKDLLLIDKFLKT